MSIDVPTVQFYSGIRTNDDSPLVPEVADLAIIGVIVAMTGSGNTGLGVVMWEEVLWCKEERLFVILLLSKIFTRMRVPPGFSNLCALIYMDEVFG